ncbi:unnamed protein product [Gongylonema pulchrum]|uniref:Gelsolin-like domain-containing protein n=1 Tax=Gongylonema pulchrum TaxID=637853 RepID=A0A3P7QEX8_9BILA|nr:unnamed protein product [Gongylonema pulchrum]
MFRSKFQGWDDIVPFDFTRTAESVQRRGADLKVQFISFSPSLFEKIAKISSKNRRKKIDIQWGRVLSVIMERDKIKTDLAPLFLPRQPAMSEEEANQLMEECNEDLELLEPFVLEGKKFVRLPQEELGTFYTMDCYVFLCRYEVIPEDDETDLEEEEDEEGEEESEAEIERSNAGDSIQLHRRKEPEEVQEDFKCVVYFWQGRDANNMGWLHFTFSHWPELFLMRANGSAVCTRTVQIDCRANQLNSAFCFILRAPYRVVDEDGLKGKVASELINRNNEFPVETIKEGEEPEKFWECLGGKKKYDVNGDFMQFTRLFRCTNEKGYFAVSEKTVDFCQDDLDDDDIMILDNGDMVFLWMGYHASEVELKLAYKAAQVCTFL